MASEHSSDGLSRRGFMKYAAIGGLAAFGAYSALVYPIGLQRWNAYRWKPWEIDLGVVDYDLVTRFGYGPPELGFQKDIRTSPAEQRVLNVAQWYDYWQGTVVEGFGPWMQEKWGVSGCEIKWLSNVYTSNEELFTWVTQAGKRFDVMVPTNYTVETMEKAGLIVNMNKDWIPNYINCFGRVPSSWPSPPPPPNKATFEPMRTDLRYTAQDTAYPEDGKSYPEFANGYNNALGYDFRDPILNGYAYRMNDQTYKNPRGTGTFTWDEQNSLLAVPYQWGTTGIGYRTDVFDDTDIRDMGWEVFELASYRNPRTNEVFDLYKKKMFLDDMRESFTAALKAVGWKKQVGFKNDNPTTADPTPIAKNTSPPYGVAPFLGDFQWSSNETANEKLGEALAWLNSFRAHSWGFNTPQQGPWLVSGERYVDQAWSGDIMYAVQPNSSTFSPVDYFVPKQGGARWIDNMVIHRESEKLWLAHQLINYISDCVTQAKVSSWNLYASPNAWAFVILYQDPTYSYTGRYPANYKDPALRNQPYYWNPATDSRIYSDFAINYTGKPILTRCEYQKDVGVQDNLNYFTYWRKAKF